MVDKFTGKQLSRAIAKFHSKRDKVYIEPGYGSLRFDGDSGMTMALETATGLSLIETILQFNNDNKGDVAFELRDDENWTYIYKKDGAKPTWTLIANFPWEEGDDEI